MTCIRLRDNALFVLAVLAGATILYLMRFAGMAYAATDPPTVIVGADPTAIAAWIGAIAGGLSLILTIAFQILKVVAPRTKTTVDDEIRDAIGEILDHVRGAALSKTTVVVAQPTTVSGTIEGAS